MKIKVDIKKGASAIGTLVHDTAELGKKVSSGVINKVASVEEKWKNDAYFKQLKKYNPLFPEEYRNTSFNRPNIIAIVDDAVRREIEVCEGSIGWLGKENDVEVLYLYDEAVDFSKVQFIPAATCDSVYCVDAFDRNKYIRSDYIFRKAQEERLAELENIAYNLGAKYCAITISEEAKEKDSKKTKAEIKESYSSATASEKFESDTNSKKSTQASGKIESNFQGHSSPRKPELKWFSHDDTVNRLIQMRCENRNSITSKTLKLSCSTFATMSKKMASAIDCTITSIGGAKGNASMDTQAENEYHCELIFHIEF